MKTYDQWIQIGHIELKKIGDSNSKPCPVIVKFAWYNIRKKVFKSKKKKKTGYQMSVLDEAKEKFGSKNVWTNEVRILYKDNNDGQKIKIYHECNLF